MVDGDPRPTASTDRLFDAYVPRTVLQHLSEDPFPPVRTVVGTMLFADLSGFTRLSERLQRRGPEGAELLVDTINGCFERLLRVAYDNGGSLQKFGGDALLLFFDGDRHAERACRAAVRMRERLRSVGRVEVAGARGTLRMTIGLHSGDFHFFLVGESHLEHLVLGSGATGVVRAEAEASNGQIVISAETAALLPPGCAGGPAGSGFLLRRSPLGIDIAHAEEPPRPPQELVARTLSTAVRAHVRGGRPQPEHRRVSVAFLRFGGTDGIIARDGLAAAASAVHELVRDVQRAADEWEICFLDSDIDADGGKVLLAAGAPRVVGDDDERMLLAMRRVLEGERTLGVSIGVHRGPAFAGEIGPPYRRAYTVMGDTTNLAARVMSRAPVGALYATAGILERSTTRFATVALEPFAAKGKSRPVQAWAVGPARRGAPPARIAGPRPDLVGRESELEALEHAVGEVVPRRGVLVEIVGDAGIGKSRLAEEARSRALNLTLSRASSPGWSQSVRMSVRVTCEAQWAAVPYSTWHSMLRQVLGLAWEQPPGEVWRLLRLQCAAQDPDLLPWAPLLADAIGVPAPRTPEVDALRPGFRRSRLHEVVLRFLAPALRRPAFVEIDQAHLMDSASAALLGALVPALASSPWLVVVTRRAGPSGFVAATCPEVLRLVPEPLTVGDARKLAEAATDADPLPPHVLDEAVERSGGNPQFLLDLLAAAATGGAVELPDSAQAAAMAQIDALAPGDRALVRHASVLGSGFQPAQLAALLNRPVGDLGPETWARLDAVFDTAESNEIRFRRAVVREAAYAGLPYRERRDLHAEVAAALEAGSEGGAAGGVPIDPAVLSRHFGLAGQPARALPLALRAAERATAHGAPADAARLYRSAVDCARAVGLTGDQLAEIWEALGDALRLAGESSAADRAFREARRGVAGDPVHTAELLYRQARLAHRAGRARAAVRWARRGLRELAGSEGPEAFAWRARLTVSEASDRFQQGQVGGAIRLYRLALAQAERGAGAVAERALAHACYLLDWALVADGRSAEAVHSSRALEIYDRLGDLEDKSNVLNNLGMFAYWDGRWDDAVRLYREGAELCERIGDVMGAAYGDCNVGEVLSDQGHWEEAEVCLNRVLRLWRATGDEAGCAFARMLLGRLAMRTGRFDEGLALLEAAAAEFYRLGMQDAAVAEAYEAEAAAYAGLTDHALGAVERAEVPALPRLTPLLVRVRALASVEEGPAAVTAALESALAAAGAEGSDYDAAVTLDALCRLAPAADASDRAAERDALFLRLGIRRLPVPPLPI
jgi:class 3 adenylate cyclase/tetratricopeptide (TPR) repeat protein